MQILLHNKNIVLDPINRMELILHSKGEIYGGGIVFYTTDNGKHGLIASISDVQTGSWGCNGLNIEGANPTAIGYGALNTAAIRAGCVSNFTAAAYCDNSTVSGYTDWFLPSKDELNEIWLNRDLFGGWNSSSFPSGTYLSSSQWDTGPSNFVWIITILGIGYISKSAVAGARPIRSF